MSPKSLYLASLAVLVFAGCATVGEPERVAAVPECKVYPLDPTIASGGPRRDVREIDQQAATAQLATSELRWHMLSRPFGQTGLIEEALRDCH